MCIVPHVPAVVAHQGLAPSKCRTHQTRSRVKRRRAGPLNGALLPWTADRRGVVSLTVMVGSASAGVTTSIHGVPGLGLGVSAAQVPAAEVSLSSLPSKCRTHHSLGRGEARRGRTVNGRMSPAAPITAQWYRLCAALVTVPLVLPQPSTALQLRVSQVHSFLSGITRVCTRSAADVSDAVAP